MLSELLSEMFGKQSNHPQVMQSVKHKHKSIETRMRGKAQPDGRMAVELIETLVRLSLIPTRATTSCCHRKISGIKLRNHKIEIYVCPLHSLKLKSTLSHGLNIV